MTLLSKSSFDLRLCGLPTGTLVLLLIAGGCTHTPESGGFGIDAIQQLKTGHTSQQVRKLFGAPHATQDGSGGNRLELYSTPVRNAKGGSLIETEVLYVLYNPAGEVEKIAHFTNQISRLPGAKQRLGTFIPDDDLERIVRDATTVDDLIDYYGPPTQRGIIITGYDFVMWEYIEPRRTRELKVIVDTNSVVRSFSTRDIPP